MTTTSYEYERFITTVEQKAEIGWEKAERAARATLAVLAERLSAGEARDIAQQLPGDLRRWLTSGNGAEPFHADEFLRRVAEREEVDLATAERHAQAVFAALGRTLTPQELRDMAAELPKDFEPLLAVARDWAEKRGRHEILPVEEFWTRVADRSGLDLDGARRATEAVLEALAERIAGGEVQDLAAQLAPELKPPLERGSTRSKGKARRMSLTEFLARVAELEGCTPEQARDHAHAVLATLRDAIPEKELADLLAELPDTYRDLLRAR